jgi:polyisoprenoid-binding protein YceI
MRQMTKFFFSLFLLSTIAASAQSSYPAKGDLVKVSSTASKVEWTARKVTGKHNGTVNIKEGSLKISDGFLVGGSFTIDMTSIKDMDMQGEYAAKLEGHLKSDDFFGVDAYPTATLVITQANAKGNGQYEIKANMTIKGITQPITFNALLTPESKRYKATANLVIDRTLYNVKYGSGKFFEGLGDKTVYDEFDLAVSLVSE